MKRTIALAVAIVLGGAYAVDNAYAANLERRIGEETRQHAHLDATPKIYLGGVPYAQALITGEIPIISSEVLDVDVPRLGMVNARTEARGVEVTPEQVREGNITGARAGLLTRRISMDGVALGHLLNMTDLDISQPYDMSPNGGDAAEVRLRGTPPGATEPVTELAKLRIIGDTINIIPEHNDAFALTFTNAEMPLTAPASKIFVAGGSIYVESLERNVLLDATDLSPLSRST